MPRLSFRRFGGYHSSTRKSKGRKAPARCRLHVETLEDRRVLSAIGLTISPPDIPENGGIAFATATISAATSSDLTLTLASDDTSEAVVPATAKILAGRSSVNFAVTSVDDFILDGDILVTITASASGLTSGTAFVCVRDNDGGTTSTCVSSNNPPDAADDTGSTDEDSVLIVVDPGATSSLLENDTDPDGDALTVTAYDLISAEGATVTVNADGTFTYDPTGSAALQALCPGDEVEDSFTYTIGDGKGGSDVATVFITVTGVNDPPDAADDTGSTDEDTVLIVVDPGATRSLLENDTDPDGAALTVTSYDPISAEGATVTVNADGTFTFDPAGSAALQALSAGDEVEDNFTYTIGDGKGGSDVATVFITVTGVNEDIDSLYDALLGKISDAGLSGGFTSALSKKVENAQENPDKEDAIDQLGAFINQTKAFASVGILTSTDSEEWIECAEALIAALEASC